MAFKEGMAAPPGFEPGSRGSKPPMLDHYTTGLHGRILMEALINVLGWVLAAAEILKHPRERSPCSKFGR